MLCFLRGFKWHFREINKLYGPQYILYTLVWLLLYLPLRLREVGLTCLQPFMVWPGSNTKETLKRRTVSCWRRPSSCSLTLSDRFSHNFTVHLLITHGDVWSISHTHTHTLHPSVCVCRMWGHALALFLPHSGSHSQSHINTHTLTHSQS